MPRGSWKAMVTTSCTVKKNNKNNNNIQGKKSKPRFEDGKISRWCEIRTAQPRTLIAALVTRCDLFNGSRAGTPPGAALLSGVSSARYLCHPGTNLVLNTNGLLTKVMTRSHHLGLVLETQTLLFF